ncbi:MAG TPA: GNVR domain-containing protein [Burkholderiales bacterium]|nr:GNVR domain-containing protein [Burkholderiales bacterium]
MSFTQFLTILRVRAALILVVVLLAGAAAALVTQALPERYLATASVVIDPNVTQAAGGASSGRPDEFMSTHLDLVANPAVAAGVSDALGLENRPGIGVLLSGSSLMRALLQLTAMLPDSEGQDSAAMSPRDWIADRLLRNLTVRANRDSRIIRITYAAPDPNFAAEVANAFARSYLDTVRQLQVGPAQEYAQSFEEPIKNLKRDLEQAEAKFARFQQQKGIVATDERMDLESARLNDLSSQVVAAQSLSYESEARQRQLRDYLARGGGDGPAEIMSSPVVQQLKQSVSDREAKLAELSKRIGPNHPQHRAAVTELEGLKAQLSEQTRAAAQGLLTSGGVASQREGALRAAMEQQRRRVLALKSDRNTLAMLAREVDGARQAYEAAVQRVTQSRVTSHAGQTSATVVNSATPPMNPASPKPALNLAIGLAAGLVLGIGLALYRESVDGYVRSERDVIEILGAPVLAVLLPRGGRRDIRALQGPNVLSLPHRPG